MQTLLRAALVTAGLSIAAPASAQDIVDAASGTDSLSTLVTAVSEAGLVDTLKGEGPFTVFAPTNDAFAALPEGALDGLLADTDALTGVLTYHVVSGEVMAADVIALVEQSGGSAAVETVAGGSITIMVEGGSVMIEDAQGNTATVIQADVDVDNGVVHVIDGVLLP
ncbi:MAG: fasciclin domain-containing protein [Pseudomonadota bacterium]